MTLIAGQDLFHVDSYVDSGLEESHMAWAAHFVVHYGILWI